MTRPIRATQKGNAPVRTMATPGPSEKTWNPMPAARYAAPPIATMIEGIVAPPSALRRALQPPPMNPGAGIDAVVPARVAHRAQATAAQDRLPVDAPRA
jgi:hypothetical protein